MDRLHHYGNLLAYAGWLLFFALLLLYYRLWTSTSGKALQELRTKLKEANDTIDQLRTLEMELKNRNDKLRTDYNRLHAEYTDLRQKLSHLEVAFGTIGDKLAQTREELEKEKKLRDAQYMELVKAQAKNGDL